MDVDVQVEKVLPFPTAEVAAYAGDPANAPRWYANIRSVSWRSGPPVTVGSLLDFEARFLGRRLVYTYRVEELEVGRRLVMRTADGPFPMETTYTWEHVPGGTLMRLRNRGRPSGFSIVAAPLLARAMRRGHGQGPGPPGRSARGGLRAAPEALGLVAWAPCERFASAQSAAPERPTGSADRLDPRRGAPQ